MNVLYVHLGSSSGQSAEWSRVGGRFPFLCGGFMSRVGEPASSAAGGGPLVGRRERLPPPSSLLLPPSLPPSSFCILLPPFHPQANSINGSLLVLGRVVNALTDSKPTHVPYRGQGPPGGHGPYPSGNMGGGVSLFPAPGPSHRPSDVSLPPEGGQGSALPSSPSSRASSSTPSPAWARPPPAPRQSRRFWRGGEWQQ